MLATLHVAAMVGGRAAEHGELEAVISLGRCSAVIVAPDIVLTSAHCVQPPPEIVSVAKHDVRVLRCEAHPGYRPQALLHDLGACKLASAAPVAAIPIDDSPVPIGQAVALAGYGSTDPFARDAGALRVVETSVVYVGTQDVDVGTADRTACWGDSGGPVLIRSATGVRVVGILHGATGAICASPAEALLLRPEREWLERAGATPLAETGKKHGLAAGCLLLTLLAIGTAAGRWVYARHKA